MTNFTKLLANKCFGIMGSDLSLCYQVNPHPANVENMVSS